MKTLKKMIMLSVIAAGLSSSYAMDNSRSDLNQSCYSDRSSYSNPVNYKEQLESSIKQINDKNTKPSDLEALLNQGINAAENLYAEELQKHIITQDKLDGKHNKFGIKPVGKNKLTLEENMRIIENNLGHIDAKKQSLEKYQESYNRFVTDLNNELDQTTAYFETLYEEENEHYNQAIEALNTAEDLDELEKIKATIAIQKIFIEVAKQPTTNEEPIDFEASVQKNMPNIIKESKINHLTGHIMDPYEEKMEEQYNVENLNNSTFDGVKTTNPNPFMKKKEEE